MKKDKTPSSEKLIIKALIDNFFTEILNTFEMKKRAIRDLIVFIFGIILYTQHNSSHSFYNAVPGSPEPSNLNKSLHEFSDIYQSIYLHAVSSAIMWYLSLKDVYTGTPIYISIDDTFIEKSGKQKSLKNVKYCGHKKKHGFYIVAIHIQIGKYHLHGGFRIYQWGGRTKHKLALDLLKEIQPLLSGGNNVTVLADSWYAEKKLMKYVINKCGWTWISGIKCNRKLDGKSVTQRFKYICNEKYINVSMYKRDFLATGLIGQLNDFSESGLFLASKTKKKSYARTSWRYYYCSNSKLSVQEVLKRYENRWRIENDFWTLKENLAISDFRYRDEKVVETYLSLVFLVYTWICHLKNMASVRLKKASVSYGVCDMLVEMRRVIQSFLSEHGSGGLDVLLKEFMERQSQKEHPK